MQTVTINFTVSGQTLKVTSLPIKIASNTVKYVKAVFALDSDWTGFDVVSAIWYNDFAQIAVVLDENGECMIPHEVLAKPDDVMVNLVGRDIVNDELVDRLTTYPAKALDVDANAKITGTETAPVTPSQFEQYIAIVEQLVGSVKDIDHTELNADYTLTIYYTDGTSDTVGPIRGAQGETGNGILSAVLNPDYTLTLNYTNGQHDTVGPIRGAQGETGNGIQSIYLTGTSGAVKTYTILFTDGNTTEFQVTDGEVTNAVLESLMPTDTANGSIASFPDGQSVFPLKSCVVQINPIQDTSGGDPSPSNICPISGWNSVEVTRTGKNLFDAETYATANGCTYSNGTLSKSSSIYGAIVWRNLSGSNSRVTISGTISAESISNKTVCWIFYYTDGTNNSYYPWSSTSPTSQSGKVVSYIMQSYGTNGAWSVTNLQIELGSTATAYESYNGTTHTTNLPSTVYGGTLDVVSGVLTIDRYYGVGIDWSQYNTSNGYIAYRVQNLPVSSAEHYSTPTTAQPISNMVAEFGTFSSSAMNKNIIQITAQDQTQWTYMALKADANPSNVQLCYKLATPTTIQLTASQINTLKGTNNIFADSGDVSVEYVADIQGYIDKKL